MVFRRLIQKEYPNPDEVRMTLGEHLEELRTRLIRAIAALLIGAVVCFIFIDYIQAFLTWPVFAVLRSQGKTDNLGYFNVTEPFLIDIKIALIVGLIISAPFSLAQIWGFVAAGLYPKERQWVRKFVPVSIVLFFVGVAFLLLIVSPMLVSFLISYRTELPNIERYMPTFMIGEARQQLTVTKPDILWPTSQPTMQKIPCFEEDPLDPPEAVPWINLHNSEIRMRIGDDIMALRPQKTGTKNKLNPTIRITEYVMFILHLSVAFGIGFQVPVVVAFLAAIGIAEAQSMGQLRRYVWFGMAFLSAIITPPDVTSMMFLLLPMALLYEVGLIAARIIEKKHSEENKTP